jgi:hypothetical protein
MPSAFAVLRLIASDFAALVTRFFGRSTNRSVISGGVPNDGASERHPVCTEN